MMASLMFVPRSEQTVRPPRRALDNHTIENGAINIFSHYSGDTNNFLLFAHPTLCNKYQQLQSSKV